jgi:hypothetical protein
MEFIDQFRKEDWTKRLAKAQYLRQKYPGRIPLIVDRGNAMTPKLTDNRFIVPLEMTRENDKQITESESVTMGYLMRIIRKHMPSLTPDQGLFMFLYEKNVIPPGNATLSQIYSENQDKDGFIYLMVFVESIFGTDS